MTVATKTNFSEEKSIYSYSKIEPPHGGFFLLSLTLAEYESRSSRLSTDRQGLAKQFSKGEGFVTSMGMCIVILLDDWHSIR